MRARHRARDLVVAAAAVVAVLGPGSACGDVGGASGRSTTSGGDASEQAAQRVAGRYAHYDVVAYEGDGMKTLIISYGFTDLDVVDGELTAHESFCFSEHRTDQPIEVSLSDAATRAIRPVPVAVELALDAGRVRLHRPETPTGIGVRLEDPAHDPLPSDPSDPRIADDDGDGRPGVTAHIVVSPELSGDLYLARREIFAYDVEEQQDGSLTGVVHDRSEQLVIGASNPAFATGAQWVQHPDLSRSPIILRPVPRSWDCEKLRAERDGLFPPTPTVDW